MPVLNVRNGARHLSRGLGSPVWRLKAAGAAREPPPRRQPHTSVRMIEAVAFHGCGTVVRVDGTRVILIGRIIHERALIVTTDGVREIESETIKQSPAQCERCGHPFWWWLSDHQPRCLACDQPDSLWKDSVFIQAQQFIERSSRSTTSDLAWAKTILHFALSAGGRSWGGVQKLAFAGSVPDLMKKWQEGRSR